MKVVLTPHSLVNNGFKQLDQGFSLLEDTSLQLNLPL